MLSAQETRQLERLAIRAAVDASPSAAATSHRAAAVGHGLDFHDFRHYQPGDDPRRIDWTIAARHRQLVVRQFRAEGHVRLHLLLDVSRSMTLGSPQKLASAAKIAAALSHVASERGDAIGLATFDDRVRAHVPASAGRPQLFRVLEILASPGAGSASNLDEALQQYGGTARGPGLAVVLSDFFQPALTLDGVRFLLYRGLTPALVQIVSDDELQPAIADSEMVELTDIERSHVRSVVADRRAVSLYQRRLAVLVGELQGFCSSRGLPWLQVSSSMPFERVLNGCVRAGLLSTAT